jgi:hypothetical protein
MLVAVATIVGHSSMPHHHHVDIQALAHHDDHHKDKGKDTHHHDHEQKEKDHHNIFSFAQLDEDFLPSQFSKANIDLPILYLLTPVISFQLNKLKEQSKTHFGYYREFPPPDNYSSNLFSRPPPEAFAA